MLVDCICSRCGDKQTVPAYAEPEVNWNGNKPGRSEDLMPRGESAERKYEDRKDEIIACWEAHDKKIGPASKELQLAYATVTGKLVQWGVLPKPDWYGARGQGKAKKSGRPHPEDLAVAPPPETSPTNQVDQLRHTISERVKQRDQLVAEIARLCGEFVGVDQELRTLTLAQGILETQG